MKQKMINKKLSLKKVTVTDLEMNQTRGGFTVDFTCNYSDCGDGPATVIPCLCE